MRVAFDEEYAMARLLAVRDPRIVNAQLEGRSAVKTEFYERICGSASADRSGSTYANSRATCVFFIESDHHSLPVFSTRNEYFDLTRTDLGTVADCLVTRDQGVAKYIHPRAQTKSKP